MTGRMQMTIVLMMYVIVKQIRLNLNGKIAPRKDTAMSKFQDRNEVKNPGCQMAEVFTRDEDKENHESRPNVNITPGAIMLTPTTKSAGPTPDRSVSFLMSVTCQLLESLHPKSFG